jgi:predicted transcriptional regulator
MARKIRQPHRSRCGVVNEILQVVFSSLPIKRRHKTGIAYATNLTHKQTVKYLDGLIEERLLILNPLAEGGGVEETEKNETVELLDDNIRKRIGEFHSSYDDYAYDAFWVAALSEATALKHQVKNSSSTAETDYIDFLKKTFIDIADSYSGITGKTILIEYGDKKFGYYDFWAIEDKEDNNGLDFHWVRVGKAQFT